MHLRTKRQGIKMSGYYGQSASFARAQFAYDNMEPPDWDGDGVEYQTCNAEIEPAEDAPEDAEPTVCTFAAKVDVNYAGHTAYWTCPECGTEHEDEIEEPDDDRDR